MMNVYYEVVPDGKFWNVFKRWTDDRGGKWFHLEASGMSKSAAEAAKRLFEA